MWEPTGGGETSCLTYLSSHLPLPPASTRPVRKGEVESLLGVGLGHPPALWSYQ